MSDSGCSEDSSDPARGAFIDAQTRAKLTDISRMQVICWIRQDLFTLQPNQDLTVNASIDILLTRLKEPFIYYPE